MRRNLLVVLLLTCVGLSSPAFGKVYFTVKQLLGQHFHDASRVTFRRIPVTGALKATLERRLARTGLKNEYVVYVALRGDDALGYAVFDQELGLHEKIDFATFFDERGVITRAEVVAYREGHGAEIRRDSFRRQFVGRSAKSGFRVGTDIDSISGATISSESMSRAVERAAVLLEVGVLAEQP